MKDSHFVAALAGLLLIGGSLLFARPGQANAPGILPALPQAPTFQLLSIAPSGVNVSRTQIVPGASGDLHLVYSAASTNAANKFPAYYAYCAGACAAAAHWSLTEVGELLAWGNYTRLAVDGNDHPRVMWEPWAPGAVTGAFQYSECSGGCTNKANWSPPVTVAETGSTGEPNDYFSLDHLGRPRFVYADNHGGHTGTFYVYCDGGCASAANWHEVTIITAETTHFSLAFTGSNQPRLAFSFYDYTNYYVGYAECVAPCSNGANWNNALLYYAGPQNNLRLRLDSNDRPRIAFYTGVIGGNAADDLMFYTWCNGACLTGANWGSANPGVPIHYGETLDLILDGQNRPHLALFADVSPYGLFYTYCTAACESGGGAWVSSWVETNADMNARVPVPVAPGCSISQWYPGANPSLALIAGAPVFSYDAEHLQAGSCTAHTDIRDATLALGANPQPSRHLMFLPKVSR